MVQATLAPVGPVTLDSRMQHPPAQLQVSCRQGTGQGILCGEELVAEVAQDRRGLVWLGIASQLGQVLPYYVCLRGTPDGFLHWLPLRQPD